MQGLALPSLTSYLESRPPLGFSIFRSAHMSRETVKGSAQMLHTHVVTIPLPEPK